MANPKASGEGGPPVDSAVEGADHPELEASKGGWLLERLGRLRGDGSALLGRDGRPRSENETGGDEAHAG